MNEFVNKELCDERFNNIEKQISNHDKKINELEKVYIILERLTTNYEKQAETIKSIDGRLTNIEKEPSDKYKQIASYIITTIIGAVIMYIFTKIGIK